MSRLRFGDLVEVRKVVLYSDTCLDTRKLMLWSLGRLGRVYFVEPVSRNLVTVEFKDGSIYRYLLFDSTWLTKMQPRTTGDKQNGQASKQVQ